MTTCTKPYFEASCVLEEGHEGECELRSSTPYSKAPGRLAFGSENLLEVYTDEEGASEEIRFREIEIVSEPDSFTSATITAYVGSGVVTFVGVNNDSDGSDPQEISVELAFPSAFSGVKIGGKYIAFNKFTLAMKKSSEGEYRYTLTIERGETSERWSEVEL